MCYRVGIRHFEPAFLQIFAVVEQGTTDKEGALRINHHPNIRALDHDVTVGRPIHQVHLVLQPGTSAADDRDTKRPARTSLLLQKRQKFARSILRHLNEPFIPDLRIDGSIGIRLRCLHKEKLGPPHSESKCRTRRSKTRNRGAYDFVRGRFDAHSKKLAYSDPRLREPPTKGADDDQIAKDSFV